jgi:hypothetical protein
MTFRVFYAAGTARVSSALPRCEKIRDSRQQAPRSRSLNADSCATPRARSSTKHSSVKTKGQEMKKCDSTFKCKQSEYSKQHSFDISKDIAPQRYEFGTDFSGHMTRKIIKSRLISAITHYTAFLCSLVLEIVNIIKHSISFVKNHVFFFNLKV